MMDDLMLQSRQGAKLETEAVNLYYGKFQALRDITISIAQCSITAIRGIIKKCGNS